MFKKEELNENQKLVCGIVKMMLKINEKFLVKANTFCPVLLLNSKEIYLTMGSE